VVVGDRGLRVQRSSAALERGPPVGRPDVERRPLAEGSERLRGVEGERAAALTAIAGIPQSRSSEFLSW